LNNCLVNNYWLTKWDIEQNDKCTFCSLQTETQMHMFWECEKVQHFCNQIREWMIRRNINLVINSQIVFLGSKDITELEYLIILLGKQFIYSQRFKQFDLNILTFKIYLSHYMDIEYKLAKKNNRASRYIERWEILL
jgi:hypothetical protein